MLSLMNYRNISRECGLKRSPNLSLWSATKRLLSNRQRLMKKTRRNRLTRRSSQLQKRVVARYLAKLSRSAARPPPASQWRKTTMTPPVDYSDKRYFQLVDWLANEHKVLSQALRLGQLGLQPRRRK